MNLDAARRDCRSKAPKFELEGNLNTYVYELADTYHEIDVLHLNDMSLNELFIEALSDVENDPNVGLHGDFGKWRVTFEKLEEDAEQVSELLTPWLVARHW